MSTEVRLKRLGLFHLKDDPEALRQELNRKFLEYENKRIEAEHKENNEKAPGK
jgi:hypothetical protein